MGGGYVVELDLERFFDTLDHGTLRSFLDRRVTDGVLRRAIDKWLAAGVLENGSVSYPDDGTPQGIQERRDPCNSSDRVSAAAAGVCRCWRTSTCTKCWTCGSSGK
jgi:retron-type reverse transcriptase